MSNKVRYRFSDLIFIYWCSNNTTSSAAAVSASAPASVAPRAETAGAPDGRSRPGWSVTAAVSASANHRRSHRTQRARARTASGVSSRPRGRGCESTSRCGTGSSADGAKKRRRLWPKKRRHAEPVCVRRSAMRGIAAGGRCKNEK